VVRAIRSKGYNSVIIQEGPGGLTAEEMMMRAGFAWFFGDEIRMVDPSGKVINKIPLR
jgi:hypothetical protein